MIYLKLFLYSYISCSSLRIFVLVFFFFFIDTATTEIYTLSLHDALPILRARTWPARAGSSPPRTPRTQDRKSTRLNSSHPSISYAVFCLKKKQNNSTPLAYNANKKHAIANDTPSDCP